jgi:hypothetical protein
MRLTSLAQGGRMTARVLLLGRDMLLSKSESTITWLSPVGIQYRCLRRARFRETLGFPHPLEFLVHFVPSASGLSGVLTGLTAFPSSQSGSGSFALSCAFFMNLCLAQN